MTLMRIAIVAASAPPQMTGGASSAHWNLFLALRDAGYVVRFFTFDEASVKDGPESEIVRHGSPALWRALVGAFATVYRLVLRVAEGRTDYAYQLGYILSSAVGARRVSRSIRAFRPQLLVVPDNGSPGYFISVPPDCRAVMVAHHNSLRFLDQPLIGSFSKVDAHVAMYFERKTVARMAGVICPSNYMKEVFERTHDFQGKVSVIPNLIDEESIANVQSVNMHALLGIEPEAPIVYLPGAGSSFKGSHLVFEIIRRLSAFGATVGFYVSGTIDDPVLKEQLKFLPPNARLHCPGRVDHEKNISMAKGCSLCASPTLIENFGMAILEANFCGLPVVTFDVGGSSDIIADGVNGFIVPFLDVEAFIARSRGLLDRAASARMGAAAKSHVLERFSKRAVTGKLLAEVELTRGRAETLVASDAASENVV